MNNKIWASAVEPRHVWNRWWQAGRTEVALDDFKGTSAIDLEDSHASIDGGVHIADSGGIWLMAIFGFAGPSLHGDHFALDPKLPSDWKRLSFIVQWRDRELKIGTMQATGSVEARLERGEPMQCRRWQGIQSGPVRNVPGPSGPETRPLDGRESESQEAGDGRTITSTRGKCDAWISRAPQIVLQWSV
jgi:hypothetical protein